MRIRNTPCCSKHCLMSLPQEAGLAIARGCIDEIIGMSQAEKKQYLLEKIRGCINGRHEGSGYMIFSWTVGVAPRPSAVNVCRACFINSYDCSHGFIESLVRDIKDGIRSYERLSSASTGRVSASFIRHLEQLALRHGVALSREQIQAMTVPNSVASLAAFSWLYGFFDTVGEKQPTLNEIHLDPCTATHIYEEYKQVMGDAGEVSHT